MKAAEIAPEPAQSCAKCGAEPRPKEAGATVPPDADEVAVGTHCEWCGAEYTVPSEE